MIRVLLADDHSLVREGLKHLFELTDDVRVVAEAASGAQVLQLLNQPDFDLILLDMSMPGVSGANLISRIVARTVEIPVLVLSMHNETQIARRALDAGAMGYLTKDCEPEILLAAIRGVARGDLFLDPAVAEKMGELGSTFESPYQKLSEREFEILLLLAKGCSVNDIADQLIISNKTVSTHKMRLMKKMGFSSNADIVRYAVAQGLIG
jgi:DNA-binding NarL/FixJ family response regulator